MMEHVYRIVADPRMTPDAVRLSLYLASLGDGQHEVSPFTVRWLLGGAGGKRVERALRLASSLGYLTADVASGPVRYLCSYRGLGQRHEGAAPKFPNTRRIPSEVRRAVLQRDGGICQMCGTPIEDVELDHIRPWSEFGEHTEGNLRVTCPECNQRRARS